MSATDDARNTSHSSFTPDRAHRGRAAWRAGAACGAVAGALLALTLADRALPHHLPRWESDAAWTGAAPAPDADWPAGVVVVSAHAGRVRVRAARATDAEALAERLGALEHGRPGPMAQRRADLRARWSATLTIGPLARQSEAGDAATRLRAAAAIARDLAAGMRGCAGDVGAPAALLAAATATDRAARDGDPVAIAAVLDVEAREETRWLETLAGADDASARWSARARRRATAWDEAAAGLERGVTPFQRELVAAYLPGLALERERAVADPWSVAPLGEPPPAGRAQPVLPVWLALLAAGALAGAGLGAGLGSAVAFAAPRLARARRPVVPPAVGMRPTPEQRDAFLHLVSGIDRDRTVRGVVELAARHVARGHRVLLVDGGRRLRLHEAFGAEARRGLTEALAGELPLLALVQTTGTPGAYVLTRGEEGLEPAWGLLGRLLATARPYFGRVVLALDPAPPSNLGDALRGRVFEGWWADRGAALTRAGEAFQQRIGITLEAMELAPGSKPALEALADRASALRTQFGPPADEPPALELPDPPTPAEAVAREPVVLDCDLQVRERLRFLIWMRRIQAEGPGGVAQPQTR